MHPGSIIKIVRTAEALSQTALACRLGITRSYLSQVESGRKDPSYTLLRDIARVLDVPLVFLFADDSTDRKLQNHLQQLLAATLEARLRHSGVRRDAEDANGPPMSA